MITITIKEKVNIDKTFSNVLELFNYINNNFNIEIEELENQNNILNSKEYREYNNVFANVW